jgi:arylamine N-acetyltransferase
MSGAASELAMVRAVEELMLEKFRSEPFHNLYLLWGNPQTTSASGGTCSDKALSFLHAVRGLGVEAHLHTAFIGGAEIHRLVRLRLCGRDYFADVGNGWPSAKLYPADRQVAYNCFGIGFRTLLHADRISVLCRRQEAERHTMDIMLQPRPEAEILAKIASRFDSGIEYPFSRGIRFSRVVGDRFLFLRDDRLEIYAERAPFHAIDGIGEDRLEQILAEYFGFQLSELERGVGGGGQ